MRLHLFNPENDMALANGKANFTPPLSVQRFKSALAELPKWYAEPDDLILTPGVKVSNTQITPEPWGWSANAVVQFKNAGIKGPFPDVEKLRKLSHRRTSLALYQDLRNNGFLPYPLSESPEEITDISSIKESDIFLKSPWSCSGRGVIDCSRMDTEAIRKIASGIIRRQGSVMMEKKLEKHKDFAMLFESQGGKIRFLGISLFLNSATSSAYGGNICAPQVEIRRQLNAKYLEETIFAVIKSLETIIAPHYSGPLGVDMMIYGKDNLICPCVEINLRRTMGFVALSLAQRLGRGIFSITPWPNSEGIQLIKPNPYFSATFIPKTKL